MAKKRNLKMWVVMSVLLAGMACSIAAGDVIYVDDDAAVGGNGQNWATPYRYLQDALTAGVSGDEIRVAQGIYKPDEDSAHPNGSGSRTATLRLKNGVALRGGYAGFGQTDPDARDIEVHETILSGDLLGNDGPDFANNSENSYHVVTGSGANDTVVLDGFTITAGNANGSEQYKRGGGMYNYFGTPTVTNCTFSGNLAEFGAGMKNWSSSPTLINCTFSDNSTFGSASSKGAGMYNYPDSNPTLTNCVFSGNSARWGGGMANWSSSPTLTNCTFTGNSAISGGGGMANWSSTAMLTNCTFGGNSARYGGGMSNELGSSPTVTNCTFSGNSASATTYGGGGMANSSSSPTLTNCTFSGNSASQSGGGMWNYKNSSATVTNCILWGNTAPSGPQIYNDGTSSANVSYSDVEGGWPGETNIDADPCFADPDNGDCHLRSEAGRWDPVGESWVKDGVTSPCIDRGSLASDWTAELWPHGGRINLGAYGGTPEASMSLSTVGNVADLNIDNAVNGKDFANFADTWQTEQVLLPQDLDRNRTVDFSDLGVFADNWLKKFQEVEPVGLLAHWKLDETEGWVVQDSAGDHDAFVIAQNPLWQPTDGRVNGALEFDGIDDYVIAPFVLNPAQGPFSVFLWVKGQVPGEVILSQAGGVNWLLADPVEGKLMTGLSEPAGGRFPPQPLVSQAIITDGHWHRVGLNWDGSNRILYVDDVEAARDTQSGLASSDGSLYFGAGKDREPGSLFSGLIDDVKVYNQAVAP